MTKLSEIMERIRDHSQLTPKEKKYINENLKKKCSRCDKEKYLGKFSKQKGLNMGVSCWCKKCKTAHGKNYNKGNTRLGLGYRIRVAQTNLNKMKLKFSNKFGEKALLKALN